MDQLQKDPGGVALYKQDNGCEITFALGHLILMETLGELYALDKQFDKALHIYLKLKRGDVFTLITKHSLFDSIRDKLVLLMDFNPEQGADMLVANTDKIPVADVIAQLKEHPRMQYVYLEKLSQLDAHAGTTGTLLILHLYIFYLYVDIYVCINSRA